jgi:hypothetical protein
MGQMKLSMIEKRAFSKAEFTQATLFEITDPQLFGEFAKVMVREIVDYSITLLINIMDT